MPNRSYKTRLRGVKKGELRHPLEATITTGPFAGARRCQYWDVRDGDQWQCAHSARTGFRTCPQHGAGTRKRERRGSRQNPRLASALANTTHGEHVSEQTREVLLQRYPELAELYERHLADPNLLDLRPQIAWAKTLANWYIRHANLKRTASGLPAGQSEILLALESLEVVAKVVRHHVAAQKGRGAIGHEDLQRMVRTFGVAIARFVPAERLDECKTFVRTELTAPLLRSAVSEGDAAPTQH